MLAIKSSEKIKKLFCILSIVTVLVLFFNSILFKNVIFAPGDFLRSDTLNQNLPFKYTLFNHLKENKLPLWINSIFGGYPILAEAQIGSFYPLNLLFFKIFSFLKAYNYIIVINFLILSIGTFYFCRNLKLSKIASSLAAIVISLSSFYILHITHQNIIAASSYLPLIFLFNHKYFKEKNIDYLFLSIIVVCLSLFAGSFQMTFYICFSLFIYLILFAKKFKTKVSRILIIFMLELFICLLISSIQLMPSIELMYFSTRSGGLGNIAINSLPYHPRNLISLISPYAFGDPGLGTYPRFGLSWGMFWENTVYIGIIPLFIALYTLTKPNCILIKKFWLLILITLFLILGRYFIFFWIYYLPIFNFFRVVSRFIAIFIFYLVILFAFGFDDLTSHIKEKSNKYIISSFIGFFIIVDLFFFGYKYNPVINYQDIFKTPESALYLKDNSETRIISLASTVKYDEINKNGWRNNSERILFHKNALDPDINILWNINNIDGYTGLFLNRQQKFIDEIYNEVSFENNKIEFSEKFLKLTGLSAVKYIISPYEIINPLKLTATIKKGEDQYFIFENPHFVKRGFLTKDISQSTDTKIDSSGNLEKIKDEENEIIFKAKTNSPIWFVLQDTFYPGWKAFVNGKPIEIQEFIGVFRAIKIPKGESQIKFKYEPKTFYYGKIISLFSLFILIFSWLGIKINKKML